ncbi:MAG: hypothetical protein KUG67_03845, partial [Proteobacteria bacterium]|nr:hypothetical protein [Pseudomonadota bacterium]
MKMNTRIAILALTTAAFSTFSQDAEKPRFEIVESKIIPAQQPVTTESVDPFADDPRDGRIIFAGQPSEEDLRAFAAMGGKIVLNTRTQSEVDKLSYDEAALCEELGLMYAHIPVSSSKLTAMEPFALSELLKQTQGADGPLLMHCGSGSRAAMLYGLTLVSKDEMTKNDAITHAIEMGMSPRSVPYFE